jgi:hypothetical protein
MAPIYLPRVCAVQAHCLLSVRTQRPKPCKLLEILRKMPKSESPEKTATDVVAIQSCRFLAMIRLGYNTRREVRMMQRTLWLLVVLLTGASRLNATDYDAFELMGEVERLLKTEYWPGFNPGEIPVAVFDGKRTLLFQHPDPPEGFAPVEGRKGVYSVGGQHPQVKANTAIELGGVACGTFLLGMFKERPLNDAAGVVFHECFHVWQKENFPDRWPNSADLFTYPSDDARLLTLRRQETEALRRSLAEEDQSEGESWLALALSLKAERMKTLNQKAREWERGVELIEGTAKYVESIVAGRPLPDLPDGGFPAEQVRMRPYMIGHAWATWLDRLSPGWKEGLKEAEPPWLDDLLSKHCQGRFEMARFTQAELDAMTATAEKDVEALKEAKKTARADFLGREGWTLVIECAEGTPLWPNGFDPMNVTRLDEGEVLHTRWLRLGNESGSFEMNGLGALTVPAGEHPLFGGVKRVTVTGLAAKPVVKGVDAAVSLGVAGVELTFNGVKWNYEGQTLRLYPK